MSDTYSKILDAALQAFLYEGYDAVTLNQLASRLQLTKGAIYHYFNSKDDLLLAVMRRVVGSVEARYQQQLRSGQPVLEILKSWFSEYERDARMEEALKSKSVDIQRHFFQLYFLAISKFPVLSDDMDQVYLRFLDALEARLQEGKQTGELSSDIACDTLAQYILVLVKGSSLLSFVVPSFHGIESTMFEILCQQLSQ